MSPGELEMIFSTSRRRGLLLQSLRQLPSGFRKLTGLLVDLLLRSAEVRRGRLDGGSWYCAAGLYPPCRQLWHAASLRPAPRLVGRILSVQAILW